MQFSTQHQHPNQINILTSTGVALQNVREGGFFYDHLTVNKKEGNPMKRLHTATRFSIRCGCYNAPLLWVVTHILVTVIYANACVCV